MFANDRSQTRFLLKLCLQFGKGESSVSSGSERFARYSRPCNQESGKVKRKQQEQENVLFERNCTERYFPSRFLSFNLDANMIFVRPTLRSKTNNWKCNWAK